MNLFALSQAGQRVNRTTVDGSTGNGSTESGSVAGSGAQPLLDNYGALLFDDECDHLENKSGTLGVWKKPRLELLPTI